MKASTFVVLALALTCVSAISTVEELKESLRVDYPRLDDGQLYDLAKIYITHQDEVQAGLAEEAKRVDESLLKALPSCPALPPAPEPTNVRQLKPQNVGVVAAIGDSISCGSNAESTTWLNLKQYRGLAWSIGGDGNADTMPNMMKQFSPDLVGVSTGTGDSNIGCNKAIGGAVVQDMPGQADKLIPDLTSAANADKWKVVTIWIGGNNLCEVCKDSANNNEDVYREYLTTTIEKFRSQVSKVLIQLVAGLEYTQLVQFKGPFCSLVLPSVCDCLTSGDKAKQDASNAMNVKFNAVLYELADKYSALNEEDFNVVVQPYLIDTIIPDKSFISTADCFHPSGKGQGLIGTGLWNSMLTPISSKTNVTTPSATFKCPTEDTLIYN